MLIDFFRSSSRRAAGAGGFVEAAEVGLDGLEEFGFEKHLLEVEALEGVLLHELDDGGGEISADIAEPAGDVGIGGAKAAGAIWTT